MDNLGLFDQLFYKADQYEVISAIMGGASILEPAVPGTTLDANVIAEHLGARLSSIALLRTKFVQDPLRLGTVKKIEDPEFDISDHIFVESLPTPGDYQQLSRRLGELSAKPLTLSQMWRWTVIDGLAGGKLAVMCNIHHAVADGVGMVEALSSMYNESPVHPETRARGVRRVPAEPTALKLLGKAVAESSIRLLVKTPRFLIKNTGPVLASLGGEVKEIIASRREGDGKLALPEVEMTSLNINGYSDRRVVSWKTLPLPEIKTLAKYFGCTVNDIGLLLYSYAMESYFKGMEERVNFDLWCAVPISTRTANSAAGGNQVTIGRICLHNTIENTLTRLNAIAADAEDMKNLARPEDPVIDVRELADIVFPLAIDATLYLTGKLDLLGKVGGKIALANGLLSNVPGPRQPVYIANALMSESIPMIPAVEIMAVSGGITSVDQAITIGFHCDGEVVIRPELFVYGIEQGMKLLTKAMGPSGARTRKAVSRKLRPKKKSAGAKSA